jgi:protein TonB
VYYKLHTKLNIKNNGSTENVTYNRPPKPINLPPPKYPEEAYQKKISGTVMVKIKINKEGKVTQASIYESDNEIFNNAALEAARKYEFEPAVQKGKIVSVLMTVPVVFKIR